MLTIRYLIWNLFWLLYIGAGTVCLFVDAVTSCAITRIQFQFHFCLPHPQFNYNFIWCVVVICSFAASLKFNIWNGERKKKATTRFEKHSHKCAQWLLLFFVTISTLELPKSKRFVIFCFYFLFGCCCCCCFSSLIHFNYSHFDGKTSFFFIVICFVLIYVFKTIL